MIIELICSIAHFMLAYGVFMLALITNNIRILCGLLILMSIIKFVFYVNGRCILTLYEYNNIFPPMVNVLKNSIN